MPLIEPEELVNLDDNDLHKVAAHDRELVYAGLRTWRTNSNAHTSWACDTVSSLLETRVFHGVTIIRHDMRWN